MKYSGVAGRYCPLVVSAEWTDFAAQCANAQSCAFRPFQGAVRARISPYPKVTHDQVLDIQMLLYDELLRFAVDNPAKWTR
jgi:hypothetical protein